ncbi:MAG: TetR/AcrR family transcriptional regulator [Calothrix sp. SM1_5_4]|nr:TetR/AcrR family transcriptional regulator [Calothrix sp. SM1_5_4]
MGATKQKKIRKYDSTSRLEKSRASRRRILETLARLTVQKRGGEVHIDEIAKASGISERSIYRFFKDKKALHDEMESYVLTFVQKNFERLAELNVDGFARASFATFDENAEMTEAYVLSPMGQEARLAFRRKLKRALIDRILKSRKINGNHENQKKLAFIVTLVNASLWYDIKRDFGYNGVDMGDTVAWAIKTLIADLC